MFTNSMSDLAIALHKLSALFTKYFFLSRNYQFIKFNRFEIPRVERVGDNTDWNIHGVGLVG